MALYALGFKHSKAALSSVRMRLIRFSFILVLAALCQAPDGVAATTTRASLSSAHTAPSASRARWQHFVTHSRITRDDWGIAHVHGQTDADAVFAMMYAQAEDDFPRIERNYLTSLGRLAEAEGEKAIYQDLRMRLYVNEADLKNRYSACPGWLKQLMVAWADGLNWYLVSHPTFKPHVITTFEPWMALSFTEGSIGGDIEHIALGPLQAFYESGVEVPITADSERLVEPRGSNGIAIAGANTVNHHPLLLINPHTSFYFRSEQQVTSDQGLNVYGAATWGQFFIYQGFNEHAGWMHTSSGVNSISLFREVTLTRNGRPYYRYGATLRPMHTQRVSIHYRTPDGTLATRQFTVYKTHHGPVVRQDGDHLVSVALMYKPVAALTQSFLRTKATDYQQYLRVLGLQANSTNNTIYADAKGTIAYLHPQFIPRRDNRFDYTRPVDGSTPATDWHGLHTLNEVPQSVNPSTGWVMNTNNWPYSAAGPDSPQRQRFPAYMDTAGENPRGIHATQLLTGNNSFTPETLRDAAFDAFLPEFAVLIPHLLTAYDALPVDSVWRVQLAEQMELLRAWDRRWALQSIATTLAVLWGDELWESAKTRAESKGVSVYTVLENHLTDTERLAALQTVSDRLQQDFGTWQVPWGDMNRFQRLNATLVPTFADTAASTPVAFASARWGSLASFGARRQTGTQKYYGTSGNSFVAIVEFGETVSAHAIMAGGESGDPTSVHFGDQIERYATGHLREVYFYPKQLIGHTEAVYAPGEGVFAGSKHDPTPY